MMQIEQDDLSSAATQALLALHLQGMAHNSPPDAVFALDLSGLKTPDITVWTARLEGDVIGVGALRMLGPEHAEIKSMRTHPDHLRKGVGQQLLQHILNVAKIRGVTRVSLETGTGPAFEPALRLYRAHGFENGPAFGAYIQSDFNQFLHLSL